MIAFYFCMVALLLLLGVYPVPRLIIPGILCVLIAFLFLYVCWKLQSWLKQTSKELKDISYTPPVDTNTLPAKEILVRGSQEPIQEQSTVLLRAAEESAEVPAEELLRAVEHETV